MKQLQTLKTAAKGGLSDWLIPFRPGALAAGRADARFALTHFWIPLAVFVALVMASMVLHGDRALAGWLYAWEGHRWALRDAFLTEKVIHRLGRDLSLAAWLGVFCAWIVACLRKDRAHWRMPLAYLAFATLLATALVAWIKSWSNMDCPWDLQGLGGTRPYVGLFALRPLGLPRGVCFPAGHASGGYAWMSLYFFFLLMRPALRWLGLAAGLALGLVFGISQQLRGAHFFSHDVWTAAICWMAVLGVYVLLRERMQRTARQQRWALDAQETDRR